MLRVNQLAGFGGIISSAAPTITSSATTSVAENSRLAFTLTANMAVSWSIVGGADSALLEISGSTLRWAGNTSRDYEAPVDSGGDNVYNVTVRATNGGGHSTDQSIAVTVTNVAYATLDGFPTNMTMSGGNLIATHSNTTLAEVRSSAAHNSGKYYFEFAITNIAGSNSGVGICTTDATAFDLFNTLNACVVWHDGSGGIYINGLGSGLSIGNLANGNVIGIAVDFDNEKIWFRKSPSGNWNGQVIGSQNPASNIGGVSISGLSSKSLSPTASFGGSGTSSSESVTLNAGATTFSGTVPTGFASGWE